MKYIEGMQVFLYNGNCYELLRKDNELCLYSNSNGEFYEKLNNCMDEIEGILKRKFTVTSNDSVKIYRYKNMKSAYHTLKEHRFNLQLQGKICLGDIMEFENYFCINEKDGTIWECKK